MATRDELALLRQALGGDEWAWVLVYQQYYGLVLTWIRKLDDQSQLDYDDQVALVNAAFAKFARTITPTRLSDFPHVGSLLRYLKCCAVTCTIDELRQLQTRQRHEPLDEIAFTEAPATSDPANEVIARLMEQELWRTILAGLRSADERIVITCRFLHRMSPMEVYHLHPERFVSVKDIYRIERNVIERLRRNRQLLELAQRDSHQK